MYLNLFKSKLHRATVTEANLNYVGSITIDNKLLKESNILPNEKVQIVNINNGQRFETYVLEGEEDSGVICINGAAARLVEPGDKVIIIAYCLIEESKAREFEPKVLFLNEKNEIESIKNKEEPGTIK